MNSKKSVQVGDIFASPLPQDKYGAVKVIKIIDTSYLIGVTSYIDKQIPSIDSEKVHQPLLNEFTIDDTEKPLYKWVDGNIPKELIFIGNIPLNKEEQEIDSNIYAGDWSKGCALAVYFKWRRETDPEGFALEIQKEDEALALKNSIPKPKKMLEEKTFWEIVSLLDWSKQSEEEIIKPAVIKLATFTVWKIRQFEESLSYKLFLLDTLEHAKEMGEYCFSQQNQYFSPDLFLYARCAIVARGKEVFEDVLSNPSKMLKDTEFEILLSLSSEAYYVKKGKEFEYESGCSYETFSNKEGWQNTL
ncbi:DUF4240 domain-containing protein [Priestia megaterium]|uniref:DUF4240 domain-containing protein n=1 Tax=Priestia megaterium TaxID=1404 RepID=UPI0011293A06|nr:DUF4240 domain-containing protein [Priestia megaterium]TPF19088.1 hypothetical protein CBE78_07670 [Priestia megaterium]TPF23197.1 hypothetical protein CBE79_10180 [Priestia megaterium]